MIQRLTRRVTTHRAETKVRAPKRRINTLTRSPPRVHCNLPACSAPELDSEVVGGPGRIAVVAPPLAQRVELVVESHRSKTLACRLVPQHLERQRLTQVVGASLGL